MLAHRTLQRGVLQQLKRVILPATEDRARRAEEWLQRVSSEAADHYKASEAKVLEAQSHRDKSEALLATCRRRVKDLQTDRIRARQAEVRSIIRKQP